MTTLLEKVGEHLEELDYEIRDKGDGVYEAAHPGRWNFVFVQEVGGLLLRSYIETVRGADRLDLLDFMNDIHREAVVARIYIDESGDLAFEAWWPELYDPEGFHTFIRAWNHDISRMANHSAVQELFT